MRRRSWHRYIYKHKWRDGYVSGIALLQQQQDNKSGGAFQKISGTGSSSSKSKSSSSRSSKSSSSSKSSATSTYTYTLKINKSGKGYVSDGGNLACGTKCQDKYWAGAEVKLTAVPDGGYVFEKFTPGKECSAIYSGGFGFNDNKLIKQAFAYGPAENVVCVTTMNKKQNHYGDFQKNFMEKILNLGRKITPKFNWLLFFCGRIA